MMSVVDLSTWKRTEIFNFYRQIDCPTYSYSFDLDVTRFLEQVKAGGLSFQFSFVYVLGKVLNEIEAFRYRFDGDRPVLFDTINTSIIVSGDDPELMKIIHVPFDPDFRTFIAHAKAVAEAQTVFIDYTADERQDVFYTTCNPWIPTTQFSNTRSLNKTDAIPRFFWGRYTKRHETVQLPFTMQVHHCFVDGYHSGLFFNALCDYLATCPDIV